MAGVYQRSARRRFACANGDARSLGWRIPFLLSAALVMVGLYVRLKLEETPVFAKAVAQHERVKMPIVELFAQYWAPMLLGAA